MPEIPGRDEQILQAIINGTEYTQVPQSRIEYLLLQLKALIEGGLGVSDYTELENKPSINNVTLVGNKSLSDLGIVIDSALSTSSENPVQNKVITNAMVGEKTAGKQYVIDGQTVTAGDGAEIFNAYAGNGTMNKATGVYSHAEGVNTVATRTAAHAEGASSAAKGSFAHAEGTMTTASGDGSHAEGAGSIASASQSHAEGSGTQATAMYAHAEGSGSIASGNTAHAEGNSTTASGHASHAEGNGTVASAALSHAEGSATIAASLAQHVQGMYNVSDSNDTYAFIIGNGTGDNARHNAFAIDWNGNIYVNGSATGVNVETLSFILTPISESAYEALTTKDKPLYFIYD